MKPVKYEYLDSLRGIGCLSVLVAHVIALHPKYGIYVSGCGKIGVWLLFVMSAFLLTLPYIKERDFNLKSFYAKRVQRIYPSLLIVLLIGLFTGFIKNGGDMLAHIFISSGSGHLWAIPVEMKFYIIAPIFLILLKHVKEKRILFCSILSLCVLYALVYPYPMYIENSISLTWYLPVFFIGILLAFLFKKYEFKLKPNYTYDFIIFTIIVLFLLATPYIRQLIFSIPADRYLQNKYLYFSIGWAIIIFCCQYSLIVKKVLEGSKILKYIGNISFPLYLVHYIILMYLKDRISDFGTVALCTVILSVISATLIHYLVEKPFIKSTVSTKSGVKKLLALLSITIISLFAYEYLESQKWENRLYVPTMIQKIDNEYFIIDCWNHRVLFSTDLNADVKDWNTLTDDIYLGGHTIVSDGQLYVMDNTDRNQIIVYVKDVNGNFSKSQVIDGIGVRPHYVVYDDKHQEFYVIGSTSGTLYRFRNENGQLVLKSKEYKEELGKLYIRSISLIDGDLYTISGIGKLNKYKVSEDSFTLIESYDAPNDLRDINQITKINNNYYITVNSDGKGDTSKATIIRTKGLNEFEKGEFEDLYDELEMSSQPYFITSFDGIYYISQISADFANGIKSFEIGNDDTIVNTKDVFLWKDTLENSKDHYKDKYPKEADLMIFMGQSNMSGKANWKEAPSVEVGYEFRSITDTTKLYKLEEPFGLNENNVNGINDVFIDSGENKKSGGLVASFANSYYSNAKVPIIGVSASEGATGIEQWMPGTPFWTDALERINKAKLFLKNNNEFKLRHTYMVWCQGESDGDNAMPFSEYYNKLNDLSVSLIESGNIEKVLLIRIGDYRDDLEKYDEIISAQTQLSIDNDDIVLITTKFSEMADKKMMLDAYHYTQEGYNLVGDDAGKNAAEFVNTGKKPEIYDYQDDKLIQFP